MEEYVSRFKVCSFNLFNYIEPPHAYYDMENIYTDEQWAKKQKWIADRLAEIGADIVGFQEVFSPESLQKLVEESGYSHFAMVDNPKADDDHIFRSPGVAIASKLPILSCKPVQVDETLIKKYQLDTKFKFSRTPIKAEVLVNGFSIINVYVLHLKSKRSIFLKDDPQDDNSKTDDSNEISLGEKLKSSILGKWGSSIQRGTEAALIYEDFCKTVDSEKRPSIIIGDLNDSINSATLAHLVAGSKVDMIDGKYLSGMGDEEKRTVENYTLFDSFDIKTTSDEAKREATHYFGNRGNVIDYILLSKDFDANNRRSIAEVVEYKTYNSHLINPQYDVDSQASDHAPISITIESIF